MLTRNERATNEVINRFAGLSFPGPQSQVPHSSLVPRQAQHLELKWTVRVKPLGLVLFQ